MIMLIDIETTLLQPSSILVMDSISIEIKKLSGHSRIVKMPLSGPFTKFSKIKNQKRLYSLEIVSDSGHSIML